MKSGYYRLEHSYYSRGGNKYHGPSSSFHLSAVQNYHANTNKAKHVISINLPDDRYELYGALIAHSNTVTRKNSHLAEGLIVSFDNRMSEAHREEAIKAFTNRVTFGGKIKAYAYEHFNDPNNKHAHVQIFDVGPDGRQVGYFGRNATFRREHSPVKGNPTEWFRKAWEQECNAVLEKHGYDFRIDRRNNLERGLEPAGKHKGWKQGVELEQSSEQTRSFEHPELELSTDKHAPESTLEPLADEPDEMPSSELEEPMVISRDGEHPPQVWIKDAIEYSSEREMLHAIQAEIAHCEATKASALADKGYFTELAKEYRNGSIASAKLAYSAGEQLKDYTRPDGSLKGFRLIKFWKIDISTKSRRRGEELTSEKARHEKSQADYLASLRDAERLAQTAENRARIAEESAEAEQRRLDETILRHGPKATLEKVDQIFQDSIQDALSHVEIQDIWDSYKERLISLDQAVRAYELLGEHALAEAIRDEPLEELDLTDSEEAYPS